jgi:Tfp pilus assembly major pilin PilA
VVAIISVLAAIAIPMYQEYTLKAYKAQLDSDTKNAYSAAQAYLTSSPGSTVDSLAKLGAGGYTKSKDVVFTNASMTLVSGNLELYATALNSSGLDNNAVAYWNARVEFANAP